MVRFIVSILRISSLQTSNVVVLMTKILFMTIGVALMAFGGCTPKDEPVLPDADKDVTTVDEDDIDDIDPEKSTTVTIYGVRGAWSYGIVSIDEISVYNEKNTKVGTGAYVGDYLVPYNGSIVITYHADYSYDGSTRISKKKTDRYQVGTSKQMYIMVYCYWDYSDEEPSILYSKVTNGKES